MRKGEGLRDDSGESHLHKHRLILQLRGFKTQGFELLTRKVVGLSYRKFLYTGNPSWKGEILLKKNTLDHL